MPSRCVVTMPVRPSAELNAFAGFLACSETNSSSTCIDNKNSATVKASTAELTPTNREPKKAQEVIEIEDSPIKVKKKQGKVSSVIMPNYNGDSSSDGTDSNGTVLTPSPSSRVKESSTQPKQGRSQPTLNSFFQTGVARKTKPKKKTNMPVESCSQPSAMTNGKSLVVKEKTTAGADPLQKNELGPMPVLKEVASALRQANASHVANKNVVFHIETPVNQNISVNAALKNADEPGAQFKISSEIVDLTLESLSSNEGGVLGQAISKAPPAATKSKAISKTVRKAAAKKSALANNKLAPDEPKNGVGGILDEEQTRLWKRYARRQKEMLDRIKNDLNEETENIDRASLLGDIDLTGVNWTPAEFPDFLVGGLSSIVQGSHLPLSPLASLIEAELNGAIQRRKESDPSFPVPPLTVNSISDKIKLIAERKSYLGMHNLASGQTPVNSKVLVSDKFEDDTPHYMWRWEVSTVIILPDNLTAEVKRARSARKKLASHYKAIVRLLQAVEKTKADKGDSVKKHVIDAEERVLKFEREEEMKRLQEQEKECARLAQQKEKDEKLEEAKRKREEEKRSREEERVAKKAKKDEEKKVKDDAKRKVKEEKEAEEREEARLLEEKKQKQKKLMASFFTAPPPSLPKTQIIALLSSKSEARLKSEECRSSCELDRQSFWGQVRSESCTSVAQLRKGLTQKSKKSRLSRERSTQMADVSVTVTVAPPPGTSGGFGDDGYYSERTTIVVPNKLKFLKFHEDFRPAYRGTWRKGASKSVTGRRPLGKDSQHLDYDVDSEAEWEEEEEGVDAEDLGKEDDEMEEDEELGTDSRNYYFGDGWLANDDEIESEDDDGEVNGQTKKYKRRQKQDQGFTSWFIVGSGPEWIPSSCPSLVSGSSTSTDEKENNMLLGVGSAEAMAMLQAHSMQVYMPGLVIAMNPRKAEPPKEKAQAKEDTTAVEKVKKYEINSEDLETFCHFVHGSSLTSKDKVVEEFRLTNPKVICSRAELLRKLVVMADKHKCWDGGALWEVRKEVLSTFGLTIRLKEIQIPNAHDPAVTKPPAAAVDQAATNEGTIALTQPAAHKVVKKRKKNCIAPTSVSRPTDSDPCKTTVPGLAPVEQTEPKATNSTPPLAKSPEPKKRKVVHASASLFTAFFKKKPVEPTENN